MEWHTDCGDCGTMSKCGYDEAWRGPCKNEAPCADHASKVCASCGAPATRSCAETGQFVCGAPLCSDCEHATAPDGTNGGVGFYTTVPADTRASWKPHIRKDAQKYTPWYERVESPIP
jgi:hypothetical protein